MLPCKWAWPLFTIISTERGVHRQPYRCCLSSVGLPYGHGQHLRHELTIIHTLLQLAAHAKVFPRPSDVNLNIWGHEELGMSKRTTYGKIYLSDVRVRRPDVRARPHDPTDAVLPANAFFFPIHADAEKKHIYIFYFLFFCFFSRPCGRRPRLYYVRNGPRICMDGAIYSRGNFKMDATVHLSHGRPSSHCPRPHPSVRVTTLWRAWKHSIPAAIQSSSMLL
jgi:hypothetical protein